MVHFCLLKVPAQNVAGLRLSSLPSPHQPHTRVTLKTKAFSKSHKHFSCLAVDVPERFQEENYFNPCSARMNQTNAQLSCHSAVSGWNRKVHRPFITPSGMTNMNWNALDALSFVSSTLCNNMIISLPFLLIRFSQLFTSFWIFLAELTLLSLLTCDLRGVGKWRIRYETADRTFRPGLSSARHSRLAVKMAPTL